ncbi:hypothetical protein M0Q50_09525 [bacterium]|jgi:hypothetical protein|nr:hypothetical protein [bacterium]
MIINEIIEKEITDYENEISRELVVTERRECGDLPRYHVSFKGSEIKSKSFLIASYGNVDTIDAAIIDYCKNISEKTIVFGAYTSNRIEYYLPKLIHTKNV